MKIWLRHNAQGGYAVVMLMGLLSILLIIMLGNTQNVRQLGRELNHLEDRQREHWQHFAVRTNMAENAGVK